MPLTDDQLWTLQVVERVASSFSLLGIVTIIATFCLSEHYRNPIHRLILINSFFNLFDAVATMISLSGPRAGNDSALCQFQGFLMQMFPPADVLWTTAMAFDVFLIVFHRYDAEALRKLEWKYFSVITTLVSIPAIAFLFVDTQDKGPMYGSVTLWCAINPNWVLFRIIFYYGPIWFLILVSMVLYGLIGVNILKRKHAFKAISNDSFPLESVSQNNGDADDANAQSQDGESTISLYHTPPPSRSSLSFRQYVLMPLMIFVILLAIWIAPTTNRVASFTNPGYLSDPLLLAVGATGSLRGFWNGVVFITIGMKARKGKAAAG
ncbi:hypothetical protein V492_02908 [Pseudogymnoascus sp. VKM F-4246]|nr:hypothetical protein V492_02908 [Pseudogymnoascus sp. VKM F-4246]